MTPQKITVTHYSRCPQENYHSVERVFSIVRQHLPGDIDCRLAECRFRSRGIFRRIYIVIESFFRQSRVNHILGDVSFLAFALRPSRTILTIHDCNLLKRYSGIRRKIYWIFWYALPARRCAIITAISNYAKDELIELVHLHPHRISVVPNPVSDAYQYTPSEFNTETPNILQIGTNQNKNLIRVAHALKDIPCHLRIIGKLNQQQLQALEENNIHYTNAVNISDEQMLEEYKRSDMVVFASTYEGFGMPIIEAQAVGRPVVTSAIPPMNEVAGNAAQYVDPYDTESIRKGFQRILNNADLREELIQKGLENVKIFRAGKIAEDYAAIYRELNSA